VEQVLHADDVGPHDCVPQLFETDIARAYPGDQVLVAGRHHRCQLVIEARAAASVAGQAEVDRCELADLQAAEVVFSAFLQLVWVVDRTQESTSGV